jgi:hypothetical protein
MPEPPPGAALILVPEPLVPREEATAPGDA